MIKVSKHFIKYLMRKKANNIPYDDSELDMFYCKKDKYYTACNNSKGECVIEDFKHLFAVYDYLESNRPIEEILKEDKKIVYTSSVRGKSNG